jgi:hypothetical protein
LLAFALLALVTYSATVNVVHRHGNLLLKPAAQTITAAAVSEPGDANSSLNDSRSLGDCLICQLHQNLSTTLFSPQPQLIAPVAQARQIPAAEISYLSQSNTPRQGRAPPLTSLN